MTLWRHMAEPLVFLGIATALHAGVWIGYAELPNAGIAGQGAEGGGGSAKPTLVATPASVNGLIRAWKTAPVAGSEIAAPRAPAMAADRSAPAPVRVTAVTEHPAAPVAPPRPGADPAPTRQTDPPQAPVLPTKAQTAPRVAPRPRPEAPVRAMPAAGHGQAQTKGRGQGKATGPGTGTASNGADAVGDSRSLMSEWGGAIRARVERAKVYPRAAEAAGVTGKVTMILSLSSDGRLNEVAIQRGAGADILDRAAIAAVRKARFPAAPRGLAKDSYTFTLSLIFTR
jgi:protein TonB